jgi:peptidoglycan/xylan/chitin deacetylase (PgdA/CDA1 family)
MNASVSFDDCRHSYRARAKAVMVFDDACASIINAKQIMDENGQAGTVFVIPSYVGSVGYLSLSQLQTFYDTGWDIGNHGYDHRDLSHLTQEELYYEVNAAHDWLVANGFARSAQLFAYPYGGYNDTVIDVVKESHNLGRTIVAGNYQPHLSNFDHDIQYKLKTFVVINATSVQAVKDRIDAAILQNGLVILSFHQIVNEDACYETQCLICDFKEISDYLKSKQADIDVVTLSELYELYTEKRAADN